MAIHRDPTKCGLIERAAERVIDRWWREIIGSIGAAPPSAPQGEGAAPLAPEVRAVLRELRDRLHEIAGAYETSPVIQDVLHDLTPDAERAFRRWHSRSRKAIDQTDKLLRPQVDA